MDYFGDSQSGDVVSKPKVLAAPRVRQKLRGYTDMRRAWMVGRITFSLVLGIVLAISLASPAVGQDESKEDGCCQLVVTVESNESGIPVLLKRDGRTVKKEKTNEEGNATFFSEKSGEYRVSVPQNGKGEAWGKDVQVGKFGVEKIPASALSSDENGTTESGNGGRDASGGVESLLYAVLAVLVVILGGLLYFAFTRLDGATSPQEIETGDGDAGAGTFEETARSRDPSRNGREDEADLSTEVEELSPEDFLSGGEGSSGGKDEEETTSPDDDQVGGQETRIGPIGAGQAAQFGDIEAGQYSTVEKIGSGGMSTVWLAQDSEGRDVALKMMEKNMMDDDELVRKFLQEGEALDRINSTHPDAPVVQIHNYGYYTTGQQPCLALEYLEGSSLERVISSKSSLSIDQALPVIKQIAIALSAAHANDVYHRDVKPQNVIVVDRESSLKIKLIDFGVARHNYVSYVTMDGTLMGTPPYMSPEQGKDGKVDERSDIYSLGTLSYALLDGKPPFTDPNPLTVLTMHQEESVPPLPDHVPSPVADLIYWMLEKHPEDRPDQMWQVVGRLDELIANFVRYS